MPLGAPLLRAGGSFFEVLVLYRKRTGALMFGSRCEPAGPVRFRYSDLNEAGRASGGRGTMGFESRFRARGWFVVGATGGSVGK